VAAGSPELYQPGGWKYKSHTEPVRINGEVALSA
jgi:hypothetical protein